MDKLILDDKRRAIYRAAHDFVARHINRPWSEMDWGAVAEDMRITYQQSVFDPFAGDLLVAGYCEIERAYLAGRAENGN